MTSPFAGSFVPARTEPIGTGDIADSSVTTAKLGGDITAAGKALLDDANAAAQRTTLGLGTAATQSTAAFDAAGAAATVAGALVSLAGSLAPVATSGSASDLGAGTLDPARIANNTVPLAKLVNLAAAKVVGSVAGGAASELSASQILDLVSSTTGALLTRIAGTWGVVARVTIDDGNFALADTPTPVVAPAAGKVKAIAVPRAGRTMLSSIDSNGIPSPLQPALAFKSVGMWTAQGGTNAISNIGNVGNATTSSGGTPTTRTNDTVSYATSLRRVGVVSGAVAGNISSVRGGSGFPKVFRGDAAMKGGFFFSTRFFVSDAILVATANMFVGLAPMALILTDIAPSTLANLIGFGCDSGDTTLQLYASGAVAQARVSLGANFPVNTINTDVYEITIYAPPFGADIKWRVVRLNTSDLATGTVTGANLPASTTIMSPELFRSNGGAASAVAFDFTHAYTETEF